MEGHRRQIQVHQQQLSAMERRHAEIVAAISARSGNSAQSYGKLDTPQSLGQALPSEAEDCRASTGVFSRGLPSFAGFSRPTSAGSGVSTKSSNVPVPGKHFFMAKPPPAVDRQKSSDAQTPSCLSPHSTSGISSFVEKSEEFDSAAPHTTPRTDIAQGLPNVSEASEEQAATLLRQSRENDQIERLLEDLSLRRPLRVPFVPLESSKEGEGRPYLHGSLEVRLLLSECGNRLLVRVGTGSSSSGAGRLLDVEDFITRAEAIEARRAQRPVPIAEEVDGTDHSAIVAASPSPHDSTTVSPRASTTVSPGASTSALHGSSVPESLKKHQDPLLRAMLDTGPENGVFSNSTSAFMSPSPSATLPWKTLFKAHWNGSGPRKPGATGGSLSGMGMPQAISMYRKFLPTGVRPFFTPSETRFAFI